MGLKLKTFPSQVRLGDEEMGEESKGDGSAKEEPASENAGEVGEDLRFLSFDGRNLGVGSIIWTFFVPVRPLLFLSDDFLTMPLESAFTGRSSTFSLLPVFTVGREGRTLGKVSDLCIYLKTARTFLRTVRGLVEAEPSAWGASKYDVAGVDGGATVAGMGMSPKTSVRRLTFGDPGSIPILTCRALRLVTIWWKKACIVSSFKSGTAKGGRLDGSIMGVAGEPSCGEGVGEQKLIAGTWTRFARDSSEELIPERAALLGVGGPSRGGREEWEGPR